MKEDLRFNIDNMKHNISIMYNVGNATMAGVVAAVFGRGFGVYSPTCARQRVVEGDGGAI
jgi:hypothetical protein